MFSLQSDLDDIVSKGVVDEMDSSSNGRGGFSHFVHEFGLNGSEEKNGYRTVLSYDDDEDEEEEKTSFVSSMLGTLYDSMRVLLNNDGDDETFRSTPFRRLMWAWHPMNSDDEENRNYGGVSGKPLSMLKELVDVLRATKQPPRSLTFRYVNGPGLIDDVYRKGMPMIPAGLYHGCYNRMYGKFRREVILVYYKKYTWSSASERTECVKRMKKEI